MNISSVMNPNPVMNFRLPDDPTKLPKDLSDKYKALKDQPSGYYKFDGTLALNKEDEWKDRFSLYKNIRDTVIKLESVLKTETDSALFIEASTNYLKFNELLLNQEKGLYGMLALPINDSDIDKVGIKATKLVQNFEIRSVEKGVYDQPTGRQRAKP